MDRDTAIATLKLLATRHVHRLGDQLEAAYRDGRHYLPGFPEKRRYERALVRLGEAVAALETP